MLIIFKIKLGKQCLPNLQKEKKLVVKNVRNNTRLSKD